MQSCFVISPIGEPGSEVREHADDVFSYIVEPAARDCGFEPVRADHDARSGIITEHMYDAILNSDLLVAVLSFHNPNVFYELAIAEAAARPLVLLIQRGDTLPFDIKDRRVLTYDLRPRALFDGVHRRALVQYIEAVMAHRGEPRVPFRPSLTPLGNAARAPQSLEFGDLMVGERRRAMLAEARNRFDVAAVSGLAWFRTYGFDETMRTGLRQGLRPRVLLPSPDNPALALSFNAKFPDEIENMKREIESAFVSWRPYLAEGLQLRALSNATLHFAAILNEHRVHCSPYMHARRTGHGPSIAGDAGTPIYESMAEEFDALWAIAGPA
jgi:hypothetical protein